MTVAYPSPFGSRLKPPDDPEMQAVVKSSCYCLVATLHLLRKIVLNPCRKQCLLSKVVLGIWNNLKGLSSALRQTGGCSGKEITGIKLR